MNEQNDIFGRSKFDTLETTIRNLDLIDPFLAVSTAYVNFLVTCCCCLPEI
jgi:hypothetical protein